MQIQKLKKQGVVGRDRGNGSCNPYKDFGQYSTKPQWKMKALHQSSFKIISGDSLQLLDAVPTLIFFSHFLSHLFLKENRQYLWRWGKWHSIFTSKFLAACSGNTPVERHLGEQDIYFWLHLKNENAWWTHAFGCHHMVRAGNEGVWFICNFPSIVVLLETLLKVTSFQI